MPAELGIFDPQIETILGWAKFSWAEFPLNVFGNDDGNGNDEGDVDVVDDSDSLHHHGVVCC